MHPGNKILKKAAIFRLKPCLYFCFQLNLNKKQQLFWGGKGLYLNLTEKKAMNFW